MDINVRNYINHYNPNISILNTSLSNTSISSSFILSSVSSSSITSSLSSLSTEENKNIMKQLYYNNEGNNKENNNASINNDESSSNLFSSSLQNPLKTVINNNSHNSRTSNCSPTIIKKFSTNNYESTKLTQINILSPALSSSANDNMAPSSSLPENSTTIFSRTGLGATVRHSMNNNKTKTLPILSDNNSINNYTIIPLSSSTIQRPYYNRLQRIQHLYQQTKQQSSSNLSTNKIMNIQSLILPNTFDNIIPNDNDKITKKLLRTELYNSSINNDTNKDTNNNNNINYYRNIHYNISNPSLLLLSKSDYIPKDSLEEASPDLSSTFYTTIQSANAALSTAQKYLSNNKNNTNNNPKLSNNNPSQNQHNVSIHYNIPSTKNYSIINQVSDTGDGIYAPSPITRCQIKPPHCHS